VEPDRGGGDGIESEILVQERVAARGEVGHGDLRVAVGDGCRVYPAPSTIGR
jgi:hypothetical protein